MKLSRPDLAAYGLVALCLLVIAVLTVLGNPVPDVVTYLAVTALGVGGGVAVQGPTASSAPAAAPAPAPEPLTTEPPTGVFRMATHAP